ncbi:hypothetical protein GQ55_9G467300 [Panicum hallii var. hallii]|uniref:F-box domain-containing protein n=1 Tax=Panicum hallii var. hallii TaxID=1504633 RepID=A0A2T7CCC5_9POAL|nr:hypothetical protein GQ55_9G467300 [Panicum hallii var. hallii]
MTAAVRELPDDVLAEVLRRLAPRGLATSRCVCRAWRDAIDARRLLRADLLPRSVGGMFMEYCALYSPEFFSRPSASRPPISGSLDFMPAVRRVLSHCAGLLLCGWHGHVRYVANPATRRFARLPPSPPPTFGEAFDQAACLVYDPTVSPHYEWPPSSYATQVFSSATQRWQEASFLRVGEAAGVVADTKPSPNWNVPNHTAYWRGALYVHCLGDVISLSDAKYQIVKTPRDKTYLRLGRSEKGVYCTTSEDGFHDLPIWHLNESYGQMEWVLKHHVNLRSFARFHPYKEIVFLDASLRRGVAYHWNTAKFQDLGNIWPQDYGEIAGRVAELEMSFIYTPCWLEEFPGNSLETHQDEDCLGQIKQWSNELSSFI